MRRYGNLWGDLTSFENLLLAYRKARRGKRSQRVIERFEYDREHELIRLRQELLSGSYRPGPYQCFMIYDRKARMISAAPFRDRIVHHAFCNIVEPIFEKTFIHDSYANRVGKGTHAAVRRYQHFARNNKYVLKCDIRKFFPSIDHQILLQKLQRKIKDRQVQSLAKIIVDHSNRQEDVPGYFPGDDLYTGLERRRGIPMGNQTSQFFGNVHLDALDHFVKEELKCRQYIRYVDDFVILDDDKSRLAGIRDAIEEFLMRDRLWLHPRKRVVSRTCDGLRFLGYRLWPQRCRLSREAVLRFRRRTRRYQNMFQSGILTFEELNLRMQAWIGYAMHINSERFLDDLLSDMIFTRSVAD